MLVGILPEYQNKGANALLFYDLIPWYQKYGYKWGESQVMSRWKPTIKCRANGSILNTYNISGAAVIKRISNLTI